jgi:hypothetical protein
MLQHELAAAVKQVEQARAAARALEDVILVDAHHRQPAAVGVQRIPLPGELLFPGDLRTFSQSWRDTTCGRLTVNSLTGFGSGLGG